MYWGANPTIYAAVAGDPWDVGQEGGCSGDVPALGNGLPVKRLVGQEGGGEVHDVRTLQRGLPGGQPLCLHCFRLQ